MISCNLRTMDHGVLSYVGGVRVTNPSLPTKKIGSFDGSAPPAPLRVSSYEASKFNAGEVGTRLLPKLMTSPADGRNPRLSCDAVQDRMERNRVN